MLPAIRKFLVISALTILRHHCQGQSFAHESTAVSRSVRALTCWPSVAASLCRCNCSQMATSASAHKGQAPTDSGQDLLAGPSITARSRFEVWVLWLVWPSSQRAPIADGTSSSVLKSQEVLSRTDFQRT